MVSASSRPTDSSQRGDSGSLARMNQTIAAKRTGREHPTPSADPKARSGRGRPKSAAGIHEPESTPTPCSVPRKREQFRWQVSTSGSSAPMPMPARNRGAISIDAFTRTPSVNREYTPRFNKCRPAVVLVRQRPRCARQTMPTNPTRSPPAAPAELNCWMKVLRTPAEIE